MKSVNAVVSEICSHNCADFNCHKETCPRGSWCSSMVKCSAMPKVGPDTKCPLMQFDASQVKAPVKQGSYFGPVSDITIKDTWAVCQACEYSKIENGYISIDDAFMEHCIDCTCNHIREAMQENMAEARMS